MGFATLGAALLSALANATLRIPNALRHSHFCTHYFFVVANAPPNIKTTYQTPKHQAFLSHPHPNTPTIAFIP
jgi:hypothetical protein